MRIGSLLWKFFKFLITWLVIYALAIGISFYLYDDMALGFFVATGLLAIFLLIKFILYLYQRYQAKRRIQKLVNVDKTGIPSKSNRFFSLLFSNPIQKRLKTIFKYIKRSNLSEQGDPFYVLPWFLVIGEDGLAKNHFLAKSQLKIPDVNCPDLLSQIRDDKQLHQDFDWWFTETSIYIDVASMPDKSLAKAGSKNQPAVVWNNLLAYLGKKRAKKPIDGLILVIDIEKLLTAEKTQINDLALKHKEHVLYLMEELKIQFPCYIVFSHSDKIPGFSAWLKTLSNKKQSDALGLIKKDEWSNKDFIKKFLNNATEIIDWTVLESLFSNKTEIKIESINLINQLRNLEEKLKGYINVLCQPNPYQEIPILRGLFFSTFLEDTNKALLSNKLLSTIIPNDHYPVRLLNQYKKKLTIAKRMALSVWLSLSFILIFITLITSWRHLSFLKSAYAEYSNALDLSKQRLKLINNIDGSEIFETEIKISQLRNIEKLINTIDKEISTWHIYWFIFEDKYFIATLKARFFNHLKTQLLERLDDKFLAEASKLLNTYNESKNEEAFGDVLAKSIKILAHRINLLEAAINGSSYNQIQQLGLPFANDSIYFSYLNYAGKLNSQVIEDLNLIYLQGLVWNLDLQDLRNQVDELYKLIELFLKSSDTNMSWLVSWANQNLANKDFRLQDYWLGSGNQTEVIQVDPAYTLEGKKLIDDFLQNIYLRLNKSGAISRKDLDHYKKNFQEYYKMHYLRQWESMALSLNSGSKLLRGRQEWLEQVQTLGNQEKSPFFRLLNDMEEQLAPFYQDIFQEDQKNRALLKWYHLVYLYKQFKDYVKEDPNQPTNTGNSGIGDTALNIINKTGKVGKVISKQSKNFNKDLEKLGLFNNHIDKVMEEGSKTLESYKTALTNIALDADIRKKSLQSTENFFKNPDDPKSWNSSESEAYTALKKMQFLLDRPSIQTEAFWQLFNGPLVLAREFMIKESEAELNELWQSKFLAEIDAVPEFKRFDLIFDQGNLLNNFIDQHLSSFIEKRVGSGLRVKRIDHYAINFYDQFLDYVVRGRESYELKRKNFALQFEAFPAKTNTGALYSPVKTELILKCQSGDKQQAITNINIRTSKVITWTPDCDSLNIDIDMGVFPIQKNYSGADALPNFLRALKDNQLILRAEQFPEHTNDLLDINVKYIALKYEVANKNDLLRALQTAPVSPPKSIAYSW